VYQSKSRALKRAGQKFNIKITAENLNDNIKLVSDSGSVASKNIPGLSTALQRAISSNIGDLETASTIKKALDVLENTEEHKAGKAGAMSKTEMRVLRRKLDREAERLRKSEQSKAENAAETVGTAAGATVRKAKKVYNKVKEKTPKGVQSKIDDAVKKVQDAAQSVEDYVDNLQPPHERFDERTQAIVDLTRASVNDPEQAQEFIDNVDNFVNLLRNAGIQTNQQFADFVAANPELQENQEFFTKLADNWPTNEEVKEPTDTMSTFQMLKEKMIEAYKVANPECPV